MPFSLVFTSAPQGLTPGRSGFCTVARHREIPERLVTLLEGLGTPNGDASTSVFTFRRLDAAGQSWYILSRFTAGGLDYTQRDNRLAQHLVFTEEEAVALPPPADIASRWQGWIEKWDGEPRWLDPIKLQLKPGRPLIPCSHWRKLTGTGAKAAWLIAGESASNISLINAKDTDELLQLFAEASALLGRASWSANFTTQASVTGSEGFAWCGGETSGRHCIDLSSANHEPAPEGERARQAALGVAVPTAMRAPQQLSTENSPSSTPVYLSGWLIGVIALAICAVSVAFYFIYKPNKAESRQVTTVPVKKEPTLEEMAAAADILRANKALQELQDIMSREDYVTAARQWIEIAQISPAFTARHRDQFVPRIQACIAKSAAKALEDKLNQTGIAENPEAVDALRTEAAETLRVAKEIGAPKDAELTRLIDVGARAKLLTQLDIRDTLLVPGKWVTGSAGPKIPSTAEFDVGPKAGAKISAFLKEGITGGAGTSQSISIRLCAYRFIAQRDNSTRLHRAKLEQGASSVSVTEETPSTGQPSISLSVGSRANTVTLKFTGQPPAGFTESNQGVELLNIAGRKLCVVLLANPETLEPVRFNLGALYTDTNNQETALAPWIEPVFTRLSLIDARNGLYPAGHSFPDRTASLAISKNVLDTDLIRLNTASEATRRTEINERRRLFDSGDFLAAGGIWTIRCVDSRGNPILQIGEFR